MFEAGHIPSHTGRITTTQPLPINVVNQIKELLEHRSARDHALFELAVNSAFRATDLCQLRRADVKDLGERIELFVRERKTGRLRRVVLNEDTSDILRRWLRQSAPNHEFIFPSQRGGAITNQHLGRMVKGWSREVGFDGNVAAHSTRKAWARHLHVAAGVRLSTLMYALGHSSERQTLAYIGKLAEDVDAAYQVKV